MTIKESSDLLESFLGLKRKPVGIKFMYEASSFDAFPGVAKERKFTYCTGIRMAGMGQCLKMHHGHHACNGAAMALGFVQPGEDTLSGERRYGNGCYDSVATSKEITQEMIYCKEEPYGIGVMPLSAYETAPDVIMIIASAYNVMRIVQGYAFHHGFAGDLKTAGMQAICHDCTSLPLETGSINISMLCPGTRMIAGWGEDEMGIGIPWKYWNDIVDGVAKTINPFERDKRKKEIMKRMKDNELTMEELDIQLGKNYDDGCYIGGKVNQEISKS